MLTQILKEDIIDRIGITFLEVCLKLLKALFEVTGGGQLKIEFALVADVSDDMVVLRVGPLNT